MAQYRQYGGGGNGARNGAASDHVSIGLLGGSRHLHHHHRQWKVPPARKISIVFCVMTLSLILSTSAFFYFSLQSKGGEINDRLAQEDEKGKEINGRLAQDDENGNDTDFLIDVSHVTRIQNSQELKFRHGSDAHGQSSRYWKKDNRRRDEDYSEKELELVQDGSMDKSDNKKSSFDKSHESLDHRGDGLYNEAGRFELKMYEAQYEAFLRNTEKSTDVHSKTIQHLRDTDESKHRTLDDSDDYDDGIDLQDDQKEEYHDVGNDDKDHSGAAQLHKIDIEESSHMHHTSNKKRKIVEEADKASNDLYREESLSESSYAKINSSSGRGSFVKGHPIRKHARHSRSKEKPKRRNFSDSCDMKISNSTTLLVEPLESRKFARFSLQYTKSEEKLKEDKKWEPRFAGHQSLKEREESFIAHGQKINCGFVKGPNGSSSTGFDLAEDDAKYISSCHIAVMSCIFGNSDRLRSPIGKTVSRLSRKNVCFVMFVDEITSQTLSSEGQMPDMMGFVGYWKIVVVKNLPYPDMRRVGKIPKFLPHRLFPSARYSIWLDSKLRLQLDPLLILEYFLWRKGYEYAISNHYDRHCLWEEVAQNKKLNKYNHSVIDEQFSFYQADGMRRFNASDIDKLLPSNVPEGSFIVRAHTPMSNLFSCLWFNEVERFTPRDQLSFAYTYHKLRRTNPDKPFYLNMFKDCERRKIAKLYRHRPEEKSNIPQNETEIETKNETE